MASLISRSNATAVLNKATLTSDQASNIIKTYHSNPNKLRKKLAEPTAFITKFLSSVSDAKRSEAFELISKMSETTQNRDLRKKIRIALIRNMAKHIRTVKNQEHGIYNTLFTSLWGVSSEPEWKEKTQNAEDDLKNPNCRTVLFEKSKYKYSTTPVGTGRRGVFVYAAEMVAESRTEGEKSENVTDNTKKWVIKTENVSYSTDYCDVTITKKSDVESVITAATTINSNEANDKLVELQRLHVNRLTHASPYEAFTGCFKSLCCSWEVFRVQSRWPSIMLAGGILYTLSYIVLRPAYFYWYPPKNSHQTLWERCKSDLWQQQKMIGAGLLGCIAWWLILPTRVILHLPLIGAATQCAVSNLRKIRLESRFKKNGTFNRVSISNMDMTNKWSWFWRFSLYLLFPMMAWGGKNKKYLPNFSTYETRNKTHEQIHNALVHVVHTYNISSSEQSNEKTFTEVTETDDNRKELRKVSVFARAPGKNLREAVLHGDVTCQNIMDLLKNLADEINNFHNNNKRPHYDLKPENIMFDKETNTVTLIDCDNPNTTYTHGYISEIEENNLKNRTFSTDIYALGATIIEMRTLFEERFGDSFDNNLLDFFDGLEVQTTMMMKREPAERQDIKKLRDFFDERQGKYEAGSSAAMTLG